MSSALKNTMGVQYAMIEARIPGVPEVNHFYSEDDCGATQTKRLPLKVAAKGIKSVAGTNMWSWLFRAVLLVGLITTIVDTGDAITQQHIEFQQHVKVLEIENVEDIELLYSQRMQSEYFTRRNQLGMIVMRVVYASLPYRFYDEIRLNVLSNADAFSSGIARVTSNIYAMAILMAIALFFLTRFCMHVYTLRASATSLAKASDSIVKAVTEQIAHIQ